MHSRIIHITLLAVILTLAFSVSPSPAQDVPSRYEEDLLQLINEARENPLSVASSLGMDADQILQDLPELKDILIYGLPPLIFNEKLYAAADAHTRDMLENNYYSHISLDGRTYDDRIVESGYDPVVTGESLGMLAFFNFIEPAEAVALIFENMFRDELDPARTERRNILAGDLEEAGIGFGSGAFKIDGLIYNAYLTTCDFATSASSVIELELLELINQARDNPLAMASSLGMDPDQILYDFPELTKILTEGLPPLSLNGKLYAAATAHAMDMLENGYFSHDSLDGRTCDDRIRETAYLPLITGESMGLFSFCSDITPEQGAWFLFKNIFSAELTPDSDIERNILNPELKEVGISFIAGTSDVLGGCCDDIYLLVLNFATSLDQVNPSLVGVVYIDLNQDGLYSQGEGIPGVAISIDGPSGPGLINVYTNEAGGFAVLLEPGQYRVVARVGENEMVEYVELEEENKAVRFRVAVHGLKLETQCH